MVKAILMGLAVVCIAGAAGCSGQDENIRFESLANNYIQKFLEMNPSYATYLGDHRYDGVMDDASLQGIEAFENLNRTYLDSLKKVDLRKLSKDHSVDCRILMTNIEYMIFQSEVLEDHKWNPLVYNVGNAIYPLIAREFAPLKDRLLSVKGRLEGIPAYLEEVRKNLATPPKIHTETAIQQNQGNIGMIEGELTRFLDQVPELKDGLVPVQEAAVTALKEYGTWLETDLLPRSTGDFRLGTEKYVKKLRFALESDLSKETILERATADLESTQNAMYETALPLFKEHFPKKTEEKALTDRKKVIKAVLDKLAEDRPDNETIVDQAKADLAACEAFAREHDLMTIPDEPVRIIVMPEFQRGVAVAYCDAPGPLEEKGETFYAISPTPESWSKDRVVSFFREYNDYMLKNLTVHEAVPGHYLQLAHANKYKAPTMVRGVFSSGPFVEGWATYAEQLMVEKGFGGPQVKVQQMKMKLRLIINAMIDQKIHTAGMTEKEAMALMMDEGFQEEGEAAGKWRRALLTSTQLSTYYVGNIEINEIRKAYESKMGGQSDLKTMHDTMMSFGSPAAKYVKELMGI